MRLAELYRIAKMMTYNDFKEEVDYRLTGALKTVVSDNEFEIKLIIPDVVKSDSELLCEVCNNDQVFEIEDGFMADCPRCN